MTMVDTRHYLEGGEPVEVLAQWKVTPKAERHLVCDACGRFGGGALRLRCPCGVLGYQRVMGHGPRNVLIRRSDGSTVVRPSRGLTPVRRLGHPADTRGPARGPSGHAPSSPAVGVDSGPEKGGQHRRANRAARTPLQPSEGR